VILLHGFAEDKHIWDTVTPELASHARLICPDLPGSGESESFDDLTIKSMSDAVYSLLKNLGIHHAIILGHSMGGYVALAMLEKSPEMFLGMGLIHSTAYADDELKKTGRQKSMEFIKTHGTRKFLETIVSDLYADPRINKENIEKHISSGEKAGADTLIAYYRTMMERPDRSTVLQYSTIPILLIAGEHDKAVPLASSLKQAILPPECHFHTLKQSAHMGMTEETTHFISIIKNFINNIETKLT
jgi:pimeloyl-ACP methyl ester carboxylesterase